MDRALTPSEARVLADPKGHVGPNALLAGARFLLATGAIRAESRTDTRWWGSQSQLCLTVADVAPRTPHLRALQDALGQATQKRPCVAPGEIALHLQKTFGVGHGRFLGVVRADLQDRGLLHESEHRALGIPWRRWERTDLGESAFAALEGRLADARTIPELLGRDPAQAAAVAAGLGGLLLAFDELRPHYPELAEALRRHGRDQDDPAWVSAADSAGMAVDVASEFGLAGGLVDALDVLGALDVLSALDGVFDGAFDAGSDGGSSDGGDGGGD